MIKKVLHKINISLKIIKTYKNWPTVFLDYFKLLKKGLILYKLRNGLKYFARSKTSDFEIINEIYIIKEYDKLLHFIKENSIVIDVGAQIGVFSVLAGKLKKGVRVYSYEPFKPNCELLEKNIELNNLKENIFAYELGVGGKKGKRELIICDENTGGHGFFCENGSTKTTINVISLKDIFEKNKIKKCDFLKMDCEGAEYEIILNTSDKYLKKIKAITMEFHKNGNIENLKNFLEQKGFKVEITNIGEGILYAWQNGI
jgi:FkbM family methyltransferase